MATPRDRYRDEIDPEAERRNALNLAGHAARRHADSGAKQAAAIRFASEAGASLRELADATGLSHMTVKRIIDRAEAS